jgi:hypothetical protein
MPQDSNAGPKKLESAFAANGLLHAMLSLLKQDVLLLHLE